MTPSVGDWRGSRGARVLSVEYRLAPEFPYPAQHDDALASARWAFEQAEQIGFDADRIGLGGDSSGGHMAIWTALELQNLGFHPRCLLLFYPLLTIADQDWAARPLKDMRLVGRIAVAYIRNCLGALCDPAAFALSDEQLIDLPPTVLVSGSGLNPVQPDVVRLANDLEKVGVAVTRLDYPGLSHASLHMAAIYGPARRAVDGAASALTAMLDVRPDGHNPPSNA